MFEFYNIFRVDTNTMQLEWNLTLLDSVPEFRKILRRLKRVDDDADGRKKLFNKKELMFVFFYADMTSNNPLNALSDKERIAQARKWCQLPDNWIPDQVVSEACKAYTNIQYSYTPSLRLLQAQRKALMQAAQQFEMLSSTNDKVLQTLEVLNNEIAEEGTTKETLEKLEAFNATMAIFNSNVNYILKNSGEVKKHLATLADLVKQVKKETAESRAVYGGGTVYNRELPQKSL